MGMIFDDNDVQDMLDEFGVDCLYFQANTTPNLDGGRPRLGADSLYGFDYVAPVDARLIRTSIDYKFLHTPEGQIYQGGARFTIPKNLLINGQAVPQSIWERIFFGDVIVVKEKPVRDYDILCRGQRDTMFAFDVTKILSLKYKAADGTVQSYVYGTDYKLQINGVDMQATANPDGTTTLVPADGQIHISSQIAVVWLGPIGPAMNQNYVVSFMCSPNYIVYDDAGKPRGPSDNDLPKHFMCVKRAFFNSSDNPFDAMTHRQPILAQDTSINADIQ